MYKALYEKTKAKYFRKKNIMLGGGSQNLNVTIYGYDYCGYFKRACKFAEQNKEKFNQIKFQETNRDTLRQLVSKSPTYNKYTSPYIVVYDGQNLWEGGCDDFQDTVRKNKNFFEKK